MLSNNSTQSKASQPGSAKAVAVEEPVPVLSPLDEIEVADGGSGTPNDSSGKDTRPPVTDDFDSLFHLA